MLDSVTKTEREIISLNIMLAITAVVMGLFMLLIAKYFLNISNEMIAQITIGIFVGNVPTNLYVCLTASLYVMTRKFF